VVQTSALRQNLFYGRPGMPPLQAMDRRGATHDCWTTTEAVATRDLSGDLRDDWDRLRETLPLLEINESMPPIGNKLFGSPFP